MFREKTPLYVINSLIEHSRRYTAPDGQEMAEVPFMAPIDRHSLDYSLKMLETLYRKSGYNGVWKSHLIGEGDPESFRIHVLYQHDVGESEISVPFRDEGDSVVGALHFPIKLTDGAAYLVSSLTRILNLTDSELTISRA